jgi:hypothetical protein
MIYNRSSTYVGLNTTLWIPTLHLLVRLQMFAVISALCKGHQETNISENWITDTSLILLMMISGRHGIMVSAIVSYSRCSFFYSLRRDWIYCDIRGLPQHLHTKGGILPPKHTLPSFQSFPSIVIVFHHWNYAAEEAGINIVFLAFKLSENIPCRQ